MQGDDLDVDVLYASALPTQGWASQPAIGGEVPPQLLQLLLPQRLQWCATGAAMQAEPHHGLLEGRDTQRPGHLVAQRARGY